MSSDTTLEILTLGELKRLQEVRNIRELPLNVRIPFSISVESEVGKELGITEPIVAGFYKLRIETLSGSKICISYRPCVLEFGKAVLPIDIVYTENNYEKVVRDKVDLMYANLDKVRADWTTTAQYFAWVFGQLEEGTAYEVGGCLEVLEDFTKEN